MENTSLNPKKIKVMKAKAREQLLGNYGAVIAGTLLVIIISTIASSIATPMAGSAFTPMRMIIFYVAIFVIEWLTIFFYVGLYHMHLNAARGKELSIAQLTFPIKNGSNRFLTVSLILAIITYLSVIPSQIITNQANIMIYGTTEEAVAAATAMIVPSLVTIILAIISLILSLGFALAPLLMIDDPDMGAMEALSSSWRYMKGNKWRLFLLILSFIGLYLLGILTFCIAFIWIEPYVQQTLIVFYETIVEPTQSKPADPVEQTEPDHYFNI